MKRLIALTSTQGKTPDEVMKEMADGMAKYRAAQEKAIPEPPTPASSQPS